MTVIEAIKKEPTVSVTAVVAPDTPDSSSDSAAAVSVSVIHIIGPAEAPNQAPRTTNNDDQEAAAALGEDDDDDDDDDYNIPDGGAVAWRQVLAGHLGNVVASSLPAIFGIFQLYYTTSLSLPASTISWIGSLQMFVNNMSCVAGGRLVDLGYARESVMVGSFLVTLGVFATSLATSSYWEILLAQGVCTGLGLGLIWMPCTAVVSSYFRKRRSLALALASAGSGTGSMAFPAIVQYLMPQVGFSWAVRCLGLAVLATTVLVNLLLKPRPLRVRAGGLDKATTTTTTTTAAAATAKAKAKARVPIVDLEAFKEPTYLLFAIGTFLLYWAVYFGFFYMNTFAMTLPYHAFTTTSTTSLLLVTNAASMLSRILIGYISDHRLGPLNAYILSVASLATVLFSWMAVGSALGMYLWSAAFGLASGAAQGAFVYALASITVDSRQIGTRLGMVCGLLGFASLAGPPTAGAILGASGGWYGWAQVWAGGVMVVAAGVLGAARWKIGGCWSARV